MESSIRQDFALGVCLDNGMLLASIASGKPIPVAEILSLAAAAEAIYLSVTLESRGSGSVKDHHKIWSEVLRVFDELCGAWIEIDSDDTQIRWLRSRLEHFRGLARDRLELYTVSSSERIAHAKTRGADFEMTYSQRHGLEERGETGLSGPAHVYSIGHF